MSDIDFSGIEAKVQEIAQRKAQEILQEKLNAMKSYLQYEMITLYDAEQRMDAKARQGKKKIDSVPEDFFDSLHVVVDGMSGSIVGNVKLLSDDQSGYWKNTWLPNARKRLGLGK